MRRTALTIAGSDSSGGAGIQADIKTMLANGVYAMSAVTALTAQNTRGVTGIMEVTPEFLGEQLDNIFTDIRPDAVKIGMVSASPLIRVIAGKLKEYQAENIVVDPVMVATSGAKLISDEAVLALKEELLPMATVLTPNVPEAEVLAGRPVKTEADMETAARWISETYHCDLSLRGAVKGRPSVKRRQRSSLPGWKRQMVPGETDRQSQYPRHRLYTVQRHCLQSGQGLLPGGVCGAGQGLYLGSPGSHAGSGAGKRSHGPWIRSYGEIYGDGKESVILRR